MNQFYTRVCKNTAVGIGSTSRSNLVSQIQEIMIYSDLGRRSNSGNVETLPLPIRILPTCPEESSNFTCFECCPVSAIEFSGQLGTPWCTVIHRTFTSQMYCQREDSGNISVCSSNRVAITWHEHADKQNSDTTPHGIF